jgi:transcriptional regulator with XRE-family HTH domain
MTARGEIVQGTDGLAGNLRQMRASRGISQLELALRLGVSQRHVSFVELARAKPSRNLILSWARETGATVDERNAALVNAGYSPAVLEFGVEHGQASLAFRALSDMLAAHDPFPGIIFDADWMMRAMNEAGRSLCGIVMPDFLAGLDRPPGEMDMIAAVSHPGGLLARVRNAAEAGFALLNQLRAEQLTRPALRPRVDSLESSLLERFGHEQAGHPRAAGEPHLQLIIDTQLGTLAFLLVQTVFGLPQNVTHASLRTELWFPGDEATRRIMTTRAAEVERP